MEGRRRQRGKRAEILEIVFRVDGDSSVAEG